jgi:hypothetical protein
MANNWEHLYFFDKSGKYYNFDYDSSQDKWTGDIYLPQVSTNLFEVAQIFVLEKFVDKNTNAFKFGFPHEPINPLPTGSVTGGCGWEVEWLEDDPNVFLLFQFDFNFSTGVQSSLSIENDGPIIQKYDKIDITLDFDPTQSINAQGYVNTSLIRSEALQINLAINSPDENTYKRTLIIRDTCTGTIVAELVVYGETVGEDERLRTLTQNFGYNILEQDSTIFKNTNIKEILPDFIEVNLKRKEIMLEGHNVYPFIGSYKGLINAIRFFGYTDLEIREFWKNVNKSSPSYGKYIQSNPISIFSPTVEFNDKSITLPNKNFRKTSMFSLIYKINKIKPDSFNSDDLPLTEETFDYTLEEILIKLFGLKRKLEKEFLPLNAHIKDITGEADFFGLLNLTNTISRNDRNTIVAGIDADFKVNPSGCVLIQDLRDINQLIYNFTFQPPKNLVLGPYATGETIPLPPIGPDPNGPLGTPVDGNDFTIGDLADYYLAYFSRFAPNINTLEYIEGRSSNRLPDKPGIPVGAPIVLENTSFGTIIWDNIDSTWEQLSNANRYYTFDFQPLSPSIGDVFIIEDPITNTGATYTVQALDNDVTVRNQLLTQLTSLKTSFTDPWLFYDISAQSTTTGPVIRIFGDNVSRLNVSVIKASVLSNAEFKKEQQIDAQLYTWDGLYRGNFTEIEWTVYKEQTDIAPSFYYNIRGDINDYDKLPIVLPYVGNYTVEIKLFDLYNNISSKVKLEDVCVEAREVEYSGWYQSRKLDYTWQSEGKYLWEEFGAFWDLPISPEVTWEEETPALYDSLDRVNAILNNFGLGATPDFHLLNFQDNGKASFKGPYYWDNLPIGGWNDTFHLWWDMTMTSGDTPAFFEFKKVVPNTYLRIEDVNGNVGEHYFDATVTTLTQAKKQLNASLDPIISKYIYNLVLNSVSKEIYIQAVAKYFGLNGNFKDVDIVDVNGNRVCDYPVTGQIPSTATGCESIIFRKGNSITSNPTWNTAKFINDGKVLPKMSWILFTYDKCKIHGKDAPRWRIRNTTDSTFADIYFESKYLTYLFKKPGKYQIQLELKDSNGNKYKKERNILIIK